MKTTLEERTQALNTLLEQKVTFLQQLETQKNQLTTEIVQLQGKLELLKELQAETMSEEK